MRTLQRTRLPALITLGALTLAALVWTSIRGLNCAPDLAYLPGQCNSIAGLATPVFVAFGIWGVGLTIWCSEKRLAATGFFWVIAAGLASGAVSGAGDLSAGRLFYLTLAWLSPLSLNFHQTLLRQPRLKPARTGLRISIGLAVLWSLPLLAQTVAELQASGAFAWLRLGIRLTLVVALAAGLAYVWRGNRSGAPLAATRRAQVLVLGNLLAFTPLLLLSVIPETLSAPFYVPYEITVPWLLLSPLTYLYADRRKRFGLQEPALRNFANYSFLVIIFLAIYLGLLAVMGVSESSRARVMLAGALLSVAAVLLIAKVYPELATLTRRSFQGKSASEVVLISLAERLSLAREHRTLRVLLLEELPRVFGAPVVVFLARQDGILVSQPDEDTGEIPNATIRLPLTSALAQAVAASDRPLPVSAIHKLCSESANTEDEPALLMPTDLDLLVPLRAGGALRGIVGLGTKASEDAWSAEDLTALSMLGWQAGAALQNLWLLDEVESAKEGLTRAHRQSLLVQDRQQRELAQALHDGPVQQLLGVGYQLAALQGPECAAGPAATEIRREVLVAIDQLRDTIGSLRPPGLLELGLAAALRDHVARTQRTLPDSGPCLLLRLSERETQLPPDVAICLFRCAQEALRNALRHAKASLIVIGLRIEDNQAHLIVRDDGCGFQAPRHLSELAQADHFGLLGMAERVEWLGGLLEIQAQPGEGTLISVTLPVSAVQPEGSGG